MSVIPEITEGLGQHWRQPVDIRSAPIDGETILLTPGQFAGLADYSVSMPTGVYPGKCWKRAEFDGPILDGGQATGVWFLGWYGESDEGADWCSTNWRRIEVVA